MRRPLVILLICLASTRAILSDYCSTDQFSELAERYGYSVQAQSTRTKDGFHLTLFRLVQEGSIVEGRPVAFVQHGFRNCADSWMSNDKDKSLVAKLVEAGFDVWLGNSRGTKYSMKNDHFSQTDEEFWGFSFHEIAIFDLPALISHVLKTTGQHSLVYIGYSQGTTEMFAALADPATSKWVNRVVSHFVALAPIAFLNNLRSPYILGLLPMKDFLLSYMRIMNLNLIEKNKCSPLLKEQTDVFIRNCENEKDLPKECLVPYEETDEFPKENNLKQTGYFMNSDPQAFNLQSVAHFCQLTVSTVPIFRRYDYGAQKNMEKYGQVEPPHYNLSLVKTKITAYVGTADLISTVKDVETLKENVPQMRVNYLEKWGHLTFLLGKNCSPVYNKIVMELSNQIKPSKMKPRQTHLA